MGLFLEGSRDVKLSEGQKNLVSEKLDKIKKAIPEVFSRRTRSLKDFKHWKATEHRQVLLYTGQFILKDVLSEECYEHYMSLSIAISILCNPNVCLKEVEFAREQLKYFNRRGRQLYGDEFLVYNIHSLIHLPDCVINLQKPLDDFSSFIYENYLGKIKKMVRSPTNPITQVLNRMEEEQQVNNLKLHEETPTVKTTHPNNAFMLSDGTCVHALKEIRGKVRCRLYTYTKSLYESPCDSKLLGIQEVDGYQSVIRDLNPEELQARAMFIPNDFEDIEAGRRTRGVFLPLLHNIYNL